MTVEDYVQKYSQRSLSDNLIHKTKIRRRRYNLAKYAHTLSGQVTAKKYGMVFDIWSTTGSWHIRKGNKRGKGYKHLANTLKKQLVNTQD